MNSNDQSLSRDCWIISTNSLFSEVLGVSLFRKQLFRTANTMHPSALKEQVFSAAEEPDCLILDGDSFDDPSDLSRLFGVLDNYLPNSNLIVFCESEKWPLLASAIEFGVRGVVLKSQSIDEISAVVDAVRNGNARCASGIAAETLAQIRRLSALKVWDSNVDCHLTKREIEVLKFVANGFANKEISKTLGLSISTVKNHLHNIFEKLECHSRKTAVRNAIASGFLKCNNDKVFA